MIYGGTQMKTILSIILLVFLLGCTPSSETQTFSRQDMADVRQAQRDCFKKGGKTSTIISSKETITITCRY